MQAFSKTKSLKGFQFVTIVNVEDEAWMQREDEIGDETLTSRRLGAHLRSRRKRRRDDMGLIKKSR